MVFIPKKTLEDLEFPEVLKQVSEFAITPLGKQECLSFSPKEDQEILFLELQCVDEFLASFDNNNRIPNHGFEDLSEALRLLKVENSVLDIAAFRGIASNLETISALLRFFKKFKTYYPNLHRTGKEIEVSKEIKVSIDRVIDRFGEIRDDASETLYDLRKKITAIRGQISTLFNKARSVYQGLDYLDEIRESVVENKRVLAVKAMHRKKIKGIITGSSKTGSIVFIEPQEVADQSLKLQNILFEEKEEIKKIIFGLTEFVRPFRSQIKAHQEYLLGMDSFFARARYAQEIGGILPAINDEKELELKNAFHPLLYRTHKKENKITYPQDVHLNHSQRIIVISGPNAGGKSITLKTVGLLQVMLQSGVLIPVHERSKVCFFDRIVTDIGDNQSIENHLSTYSYRLKNMKFFLRKCNANTLLLIDEFGSGSDPELGGALAEAILENFYDKESFGLITTHYSNLKLLANEMPAMNNANMRFNNTSLEPDFKLIMGEAGSSFTFEVAQKNGLPFSLINRAKKKIEKGKVRFDATIAKLQKKRVQMSKTEDSLKEKEAVTQKASERLDLLNEKLTKKLTDYQLLFDSNKRMIVLGEKFNSLIQKYHTHKKKRALISEFLKLVEFETAKSKDQSKPTSTKGQQHKKRIKEQLQKDLKPIRTAQKKEKSTPKKQSSTVHFKVGDRVRIADSQSIGSIDAIEKDKAIVNYGFLTTQISLNQLELVKIG